MVGPRSLSVPFTYDLISSAAPAIVINGMAGGVNHLAPNFPARVSSARNMALGIANTASGHLQTLPFVGGPVPVVISPSTEVILGNMKKGRENPAFLFQGKWMRDQ